MTVTDHEVLHETAERLAPHPTTWAAPASTRSAAPGEPRPRSLTPVGRLTPVAALPGLPARPDLAGRDPGTATPRADPAWVTAGALPPVAPAVTSPTPVGGDVPTMLRPPTGAPTTGGTEEWPSQRGFRRTHVPPVPHDPDRVITDWWYEREPDPRVPLRHIALWFVLDAALLALLILLGYDVWHLLGLGTPWAA